MKWRFILDGYQLKADNINDALRVMRTQTSYQFLNWNGIIYHVDGKETGIKAEDCF